MGAPYYIKSSFTIPRDGSATGTESVISALQTIDYDEGTRTLTPRGNLSIGTEIKTMKSPIVFNAAAGTYLIGTDYPIASINGLMLYETGEDGSQELMSSYLNAPMYWHVLSCVANGPFSLSVSPAAYTSGTPFTVDADMGEVVYSPSLTHKVKVATIRNALGPIIYTGTNSYFPTVSYNVTGSIPLQPHTIPDNPISYGGQTWRAKIGTSL